VLRFLFQRPGRPIRFLKIQLFSSPIVFPRMDRRFHFPVLAWRVLAASAFVTAAPSSLESASGSR